MHQFSRETGSDPLRQLVLHFEESLKQQIDAAFEELQSLFAFVLKGIVEDLLEKHLQEFEASMTSEMQQYPPKSLTDLKRQYLLRQDLWMQKFSIQQVVRESHEREKLTAQLKEAMKSRFTQWEASLAHQLAMEEALNAPHTTSEKRARR